MKIIAPHTFLSINHNIKLVVTQLEEPNYGRLQWKYKFYEDGLLVNNKYMNYKYGGLISNLENFELESSEGKYILLPLTSGFLIYEPNNKEYLNIPATGSVGNNDFLKNLFFKNNLVLLYERSLQVMNLITKVCQVIIYPEGSYQFKDMTIIEDNISLEYFDIKKESDQNKLFKFNFINNEFE